MSLTYKAETVNLQRRDNFVRFARGLLADPAVVPLLSETSKKILAETVDKISGTTYAEIREQIGAKVGPMRLFLGKSAGDFSVTFEDIVKLLLHQDAPLEI